MNARRPPRQVDKAALRELVEFGGIPFRQNPKSYRIDCPRCRKPKLYIRKNDGKCRCMHCQQDFSGWADYILSQVYARTRDELSQSLYGATPAGLVSATVENELQFQLVDHWEEYDKEDFILSEDEDDFVDDAPPEIVWPFDYYDLAHPRAAKGLSYLESRGVPLEIAQLYSIRYVPAEQRVAFPIIVDGTLRGWQGRLIVPENHYLEDGTHLWRPKIKTTGEVGGKVLMFQDRLKGSEHGILVEGPVDAIKCHLCGGNTATMGKDFTDRQVQLYLASGIKRLYIGLDDDAALKIMKVARQLASQIELLRLETPSGREDLGDSTFEEVFERFQQAKPLNPAHQFFYLDPRPPGRSWSF